MQTAHGGPSAPRADSPLDLTHFCLTRTPPDDPEIDRIAGWLAWLHDSEFHDEANYPGDSGWSNPNWLPTPEDSAEAAGWGLGVDGLRAGPPSHYSESERAAFERGHADGFRQYVEDELERAAFEAERIEAAFGI